MLRIITNLEGNTLNLIQGVYFSLQDDLSLVVIKKYELKIDFPRLVNEDLVQAKFNTSDNELTINVPFKTH